MLHPEPPSGASARRVDRTADRLVRDLMSHDPVTISEEASLGDAADLLYGYAINGLAVVDLDGRIVGVVSQTDLVRLRASGLARSDWRRLSVGAVMTIPAAVIGVDESVRQAARRMTDEGVHRLFVIDEDQAPIGVIAASDVVMDIAESQG